MDTYTPNPYSAPAPKKSGNKLVTVMIILLLVISLANTAFIALLFINNSGGATAETQLKETKAYNAYAKATADDALKISNLKVTNTYDDSSTFSFTVENVENYDVSDVYVFYNFFDEDGNFIGSDYSYIDYMEAKSEVEIESYGNYTNIKRITVARVHAVKAEDIY